MANCLGLYVEDNIIKYAKVSKEHDNLKVESYGVKFYENLSQAIDQIIEETYSFKTPIATNLTEETYNFFNMFSLLSKKDLGKAIKTEFEMYCSEKGYNPNVFETRYAIVNNAENSEKLKIIHVSENKIELSKKAQQLEKYKLTNIVPISMTIPNILDVRPKENYLIVNIEQDTTITKIVDRKIYNVIKLDIGSKEFLDKINLKENSYLKSYEICKNTTIYTSEGKELQDIQPNYLEDIMPTLYEIAGQIMKVANESTEKINKVYLTGTATLVNNIDLYFEEYLSGIDCEILKPYFIEPTKNISIKDYIEVNTAISLALSGLGEGIQGMNFKNLGLTEKLPDFLKIEVNPDKKKPQDKKAKSGWFTNDLNEKLDKTEMNLLRTAVGLLLLFIIYTGFSVLLNNQMNKKQNEIEEVIADTNSQIVLAETDNSKVKSKTNEYTTLIKNLQDINDRITDATRSRKAIPNLLNSIMYIIPENVQITSIENTTDRHIVINAQSDKYEQLGIFKAKIQTDVILTNVISTAGQKDKGVVTVKIEGDLP